MSPTLCSEHITQEADLNEQLRLTCVHFKFAVGIGLNLTVSKQNNFSKNCLLAVGGVFLVICLQEG